MAPAPAGRFHIHRALYPTDPFNHPHGYWGPPTSTLDWCEPNYVTLYYVAEFWNTISNIPFIVASVVGVCNCIALGAEVRDYVNMAIGVFLIGVGSLAFHATLLYESQLLDELPMLYGACALVYSFFLLDNVFQTRQEKRKRIALSVFLLAYSAAVTIYYELSRQPLVFQVAYGLLAATLILSPQWRLGRLIRSFTPEQKSQIWTAYYWAIGNYLFGFLLWQFENHYCDTLRSWRAAVPAAVQPLLQFHSVWHITTQIGTRRQLTL
ncbi:Alkaline ceramidase 3 [Kappamyces sp. JEL0680]|nr:Alkaline ceramidase 3 [Kappamyces sp. JEL0680]